MTQFLRYRFFLVAAGVLLAGCQTNHAPTIDVLGSYFPAWIICIVIGLLLTAFARLLLIRARLNPHLRPVPLVYLCLMVGFALILWLVLFKN